MKKKRLPYKCICKCILNSIYAFYHISYCLHLYYTFQLCFFHDVFWPSSNHLPRHCSTAGTSHKVTSCNTSKAFKVPRTAMTVVPAAKVRCTYKTEASWWLNQPIWKIWYSQIGSFHQVEVNIFKKMKPRPRKVTCHLQKITSTFIDTGKIHPNYVTKAPGFHEIRPSISP